MEQQMDREFVRRHTAIELALDILGRAQPGISGRPTIEEVIDHAGIIEKFLRGK